MKEHRQMYLLYFLAYGIFTALLLCPQWIAPHKIPHLFATAGAVLIGTVIGAAVRARRAKLPLSRLIPAAVLVLVALVQAAGFFGWFNPAFGHEAEIFRFYLITALVNVAASAAGFFLK